MKKVLIASIIFATFGYFSVAKEADSKQNSNDTKTEQTSNGGSGNLNDGVRDSCMKIGDGMKSAGKGFENGLKSLGQGMQKAFARKDSNSSSNKNSSKEVKK